MKAVVMTAGQGTRLKPLTASRTKGMIPIGGQPILEHILKALIEAGITEVIMVVGYHRERIMRHFGDGTHMGVSVTYVEQEKLLGTAHALEMAREQLDEEFLVLAGDNLLGADGIRKLMEPMEGEWDARLLITRSENPSKYGVVGIEGDRLVRIVEKPKVSGDLLSTGMPSIFSLALWDHKEPSISNLISTGTYRFKMGVFEHLDRAAAMDHHKMTAVLNLMLEADKRIQCMETDRWLDAVYPYDLLDMTASVISPRPSVTEGTMEENVIMRGPVVVGRGTVIRANTYITGPVVIGENCDIGPSVVIAPCTSIGSNVTIEPFTSIRNSILMDDVQIGSSGRLSNSILAEGVHAGSGLVTDTETGRVMMDEYAMARELGAVIGEDTAIGHGVVIHGGVIIGTGCRISSGRIVRDNVADNAQVL